MDIEFKYVIGLIASVSTILGTIRWIKSDLAKQEKTHTDFVNTVNAHIVTIKATTDRLYERTNNVMKRDEVEDVVRKEMAPILKDISMLSTNMQVVTKSISDMAISLAVFSDRQSRSDK